MATKIVWGCCDVDCDSGVEDRVLCSVCSIPFHKECLLSSNYQSIIFTRDWKCPECMQVNKCGNSDNTPVRCSTRNSFSDSNVTRRNVKRMALSSPPDPSPSHQTCSITRDEIQDIIKDVIRDELRLITTSINASISEVISSEMKIVRDEISKIKESMNFLSNQCEDLQLAQKSSKEQIMELQNNNSKMQNTIDELNLQISSLEQRARLNNIEIQCVPENSSENLVSILMRLSEVTNAKITKEDIIKCTRVAKSNRASQRPRNIIVQFATQNIRDTFLASVIKFNKSNQHNKLNTGDIGYEGEKKPIYVTEHLSPANKALHAAARRRAKELGYKYVWVRNGRIFMRKDDMSNFKFIKDTSSLEILNKTFDTTGKK